MKVDHMDITKLQEKLAPRTIGFKLDKVDMVRVYVSFKISNICITLVHIYILFAITHIIYAFVLVLGYDPCMSRTALVVDCC